MGEQKQWFLALAATVFPLLFLLIYLSLIVFPSHPWLRLLIVFKNRKWLSYIHISSDICYCLSLLIHVYRFTQFPIHFTFLSNERHLLETLDLICRQYTIIVTLLTCISAMPMRTTFLNKIKSILSFFEYNLEHSIAKGSFSHNKILPKTHLLQRIWYRKYAKK